jgi:methionyl-tRNA formyltransferase
MTQPNLRLLVLTHGAGELALERLIGLQSVEVAGIFIETRAEPQRSPVEKLRRSIRYDGYASTALKFARKLVGSREPGSASATTEETRHRLRKIAADHSVPIHFVNDYHSSESIKMMRAANADLGILLGTNILRESVFKVPRLGSINLHQGLAPYYRGCPAIFWELYNGEREIGITVHFVEPKVDTGDILLQRTVPLEYDYNYGLDFEAFITDYRQKLTVPCANLIADAVQLIADGNETRQVQHCFLGKRYRLPIKKEKDELRRRLRARRKRAIQLGLAEKVSGD